MNPRRVLVSNQLAGRLEMKSGSLEEEQQVRWLCCMKPTQVFGLPIISPESHQKCLMHIKPGESPSTGKCGPESKHLANKSKLSSGKLATSDHETSLEICFSPKSRSWNIEWLVVAVDSTLPQKPSGWYAYEGCPWVSLSPGCDWQSNKTSCGLPVRESEFNVEKPTAACLLFVWQPLTWACYQPCQKEVSGIVFWQLDLLDIALKHFFQVPSHACHRGIKCSPWTGCQKEHHSYRVEAKHCTHHMATVVWNSQLRG